jgi:hypothetical protein
MHHDRRIGFLAAYTLIVLEPALEQYDRLVGLDRYLNDRDPTRSFTQRHHFTAIMSRMLFPGLQCLALAVGIGVYIAKGSFGAASVAGIAVATVVILAITTLTFLKVKHVRLQ